MITKFKESFIFFLIGILITALVFVFWGEDIKKFISQESSPQEIAERAINYVNENKQFFGLTEDTPASFVGVTEESGLYKITLGIGGQEFDSYVTKDGKTFFPSGIDITTELSEITEEEESTVDTIGNFSVSQDEICQEGEKPIVYFFGSQGCSHCSWEHPIIEEVAEGFGDYISFHNNMDSEADRDVFSKYSTGGIPTVVLGCKYYRVGSGERFGEEEESRTLTALICKLTESQPASVCAPVEDLINEIE